MPTPSIDVAPLITALVSLLTTFGGLMVWYVRTTVKKQEELLDKALRRNEQLSSDLLDTKADKAALTERNKAMKDDIDELRSAVMSLQHRFDDLMEQRNKERLKADERALQYQNEIIERDKNIKALQKENARLVKEIDSLKEALKSINQRLNTLNTDYSAVVTERDRLRAETKVMSDEIAALQRENAAVTKHNGEMDEKVRKMQADLDMVKAQTAPSALTTAPNDDAELGQKLLADERRKTDKYPVVKLNPGTDAA